MQTTGFFKKATAEIIKVYAGASAIKELQESVDLKKAAKGDKFCASAPYFSLPADFDFDIDNFLYYRARAITADIHNANFDLFPHSEIRTAYPTFVGKGVYFNHNSDDPNNACGIILDAVYTPVYYNDDNYEDKYVEILCAIDRKLANARYPGLVKDIETGHLTATSMGTLAKEAKCSLCGNVAHNPSELCMHVRPGSPLFRKGQKVNGEYVVEINSGLKFIEDSIVYVPADSTARMLEIFSSAKWGTNLATLFDRYAKAHGYVLQQSPIQMLENFMRTKSFIITAADEHESPAPAETVPAIPGEQAPAPKTETPKEEKPKKGTETYESALRDVGQSVEEQAKKVVEDARKRIASEEARKAFSPLNAEIDRRIRPGIIDLVQKEFHKALEEIEKVFPGISKDVAALRSTPAPAVEPMEQSPKTASISSPKFAAIIEDFANWTDSDKSALISAINTNSSWRFTAPIVVPEKHNDK